jgi:hypothetical protein
MKPLIRRSNLTDPPRYYCLTRYTIADNGNITAHAKFDVTDQIAPLIEQAAEDAIRKAAEAIREAEARG